MKMQAIDKIVLIPLLKKCTTVEKIKINSVEGRVRRC